MLDHSKAREKIEGANGRLPPSDSAWYFRRRCSGRPAHYRDSQRKKEQKCRPWDNIHQGIAILDGKIYSKWDSNLGQYSPPKRILEDTNVEVEKLREQVKRQVETIVQMKRKIQTELEEREVAERRAETAEDALKEAQKALTFATT
eukprot:UN07068